MMRKTRKAKRAKTYQYTSQPLGWNLSTPVTYSKEDAYVQTTRATNLQVNSSLPFNAEPVLSVLVSNLITPVTEYFVRNHGPVPLPTGSGDQMDYQFVTELPSGIYTRTLRQVMDGSPVARSEATLICAGNRRNELSKIIPIDGVPWDSGAIGNAVWGGVSLRLFLLSILKPGDYIQDAHVEFEGADYSPEEEREGTPGLGFVASVPLHHILCDMENRILLCVYQNEMPLTPDHGWPLRAIIPGFIGARSVKWLKRMTLRRGHATSYFMLQDYKLYSPDVIDEPSSDQWQNLPPIMDYPVNSIIGKVERTDTALKVAGYAVAGGGRTIVRVRVNNTEASLIEPNPYTWALWTVDLCANTTEKICCVAMDNAGNSQPTESVWNIGGVLANGVDCVTFKNKI
jgi:sulfite oxidase